MSSNVPFDSESRYTRLFSEHIPPHAIDVWLRRGFSIELLRVVLVVDVVSYTDKFSTIIAAREKDNSNTKDLGSGDAT